MMNFFILILSSETLLLFGLQTLENLTTAVKKAVELEAKRAVEDGLKAVAWKKEVRFNIFT